MKSLNLNNLVDFHNYILQLELDKLIINDDSIHNNIIKYIYLI